MWQVENQTPFAVERGWVRDRDGAEVWIVAAKCTFDISPKGHTSLAEQQPPVLRVPAYFAAPGKSSIKYEADLVLGKQTTDIIVVGHAYAPGGRPVRQLEVGFRVGHVRKTLMAFGKRRWQAGGVGKPEPFDTMPLVYERAFGGVDGDSAQPDTDWDWRNPVGTGFAVEEKHLDGRSLPNLEYPDALIRSWKDRPAPAGFGVIAGHWQPRVALAGTYDERWQATRLPLLPDDFDIRFHQCAPADQQAAAFLQGGESAALLNLTPEGNLSFDLPRVRPDFETHFYDGTRQLHDAPQLHTVIIEPDHPRVSLVWHSALRCHAKVHWLDRTIVRVPDLGIDGDVLVDPVGQERLGHG